MEYAVSSGCSVPLMLTLVKVLQRELRVNQVAKAQILESANRYQDFLTLLTALCPLPRVSGQAEPTRPRSRGAAAFREKLALFLVPVRVPGFRHQVTSTTPAIPYLSRSLLVRRRTLVPPP